MKQLTTALAALLVLLGLGAGTAAAHTGEGSFEVLDLQQEELSVALLVRLTYVSDGHAAVDATVTAVAEQPGAAPLTPVQLTPAGEEGLYEGTIAVPSSGTWQLRLTSVTPAATLELTEQVGPAASTTGAAPSTSTPTTAASPTRPSAPAASGQAARDGGAAGDGFPLGLVVGTGASAAAVVGAVVLVRRRRTAST